jgi:hypothetical protein
VDNDLFSALILLGVILYCGGWAVYEMIKQHRTVAEDDAVVVTPGHKPKRVRVSLDQAKEDAIEALVRDGWKRTAAVSALMSIGWRGYPDTAEMVLSAWKSMPAYRK